MCILRVIIQQVLSNLLETDDVKCRTGSLRIIKQITIHPEIRRSVTLMGGVEVSNFLNIDFCHFKNFV